MLMKKIMLGSLLIGLNACAYWPPEGEGGQAESFATAPAYWSALRQANKDKIECFDRTIQGLTYTDIRKRHPAKLNELSIIWTRALRAHAGHLDLEAQDDLVTLANHYRAFQKTLRRENHFQLASNSPALQEACTS